MPDVKRLISEVAAENGIRVEPDDPLFALVTINRMVLDEAIQRLQGQIQARIAEFNAPPGDERRLPRASLVPRSRAVPFLDPERIAKSLLPTDRPTTIHRNRSRRLRAASITPQGARCQNELPGWRPLLMEPE